MTETWRAPSDDGSGEIVEIHPVSIVDPSKVDVDQVARAMWAAVYINPTLPPPLPFDELDDHYRRMLHAMAKAAIAVVAG